MENPCNKCIIKINCTEVCNEKTNYGTLLQRSVTAHWEIIQVDNNLYFQKEYRKLMNRLRIHRQNETSIKNRQLDAKHGIL